MLSLKKIIFGSFLLVTVISALKAQPVSTELIDPMAADLKFEKDTIKYGLLENDADGWRTMKFKNTGKSPLVIQNVHGECGCTTAKDGDTKTWTQEPVAPGKWGTIKVHFDTKRTGPFVKRVFVESNAKNPKMEFMIKGEIKAPKPNGVNTPTISPAPGPQKKLPSIKAKKP
ncbi:MAG: DUF1573 domain-containing protein [Bacteroidia bacterium]|nr:DUF1573 domain-containing protein [Bacteroidia bacterium]